MKPHLPVFFSDSPPTFLSSNAEVDLGGHRAVRVHEVRERGVAVGGGERLERARQRRQLAAVDVLHVLRVGAQLRGDQAVAADLEEEGWPS